MKRISTFIIGTILSLLIVINFVSCADSQERQFTSPSDSSVNTQNATVREAVTTASNSLSRADEPTVPTESSAEEPSMTVSTPAFVVDSAVGNIGATNVPIRIRVINNPGISSIALSVFYDAQKLKLANYYINKDIGGQSIEYSQDVTEYKLVWINWSENVDDDWIFATLYFDVLTDEIGNIPILISYDPDDVYNIEENNIEFGIIQGSINLTDKTIQER